MALVLGFIAQCHRLECPEIDLWTYENSLYYRIGISQVKEKDELFNKCFWTNREASEKYKTLPISHSLL